MKKFVKNNTPSHRTGRVDVHSEHAGRNVFYFAEPE